MGMDNLKHLMAIGFTEYEARVYTALLRESPATGYQISKSSGVPRSMVYEALGRLEGRGAVLKTESRRATLYRPVPPDTLLDRYVRDQSERVQHLREGLGTLFQAREEEHYWTMRGRDSVLAYAAQLIEAARDEIQLVLSDRDLEALRSHVEEACERGVQVRALLTGEGSLDCGQVARHPPRESELQQLTNMLVAVTDRHQVLIASQTDVEMTATYTTNANLVLIAHQFVWMELFAQRVYASMGPELLARLTPEDRQILEVYAQ